MRPLRLLVRRSIPKTFLLGVLGLPLVFLAADYIWGTFGFLDLFGAWAYASGEVEAFEARDDILVALLGLIGLAFVLFALKEFVAPRRLLVANDDGIHVPLRGPFRRSDGISWYQMKELRAEGSHLLIQLVTRGDLPSDPWNARWDDETTLRLKTTWWDRRPDNALGRMKALGFRPLTKPDPLHGDGLHAAITDGVGGWGTSEMHAVDDLDRVLEGLLVEDDETAEPLAADTESAATAVEDDETAEPVDTDVAGQLVEHAESAEAGEPAADDPDEE